MSIALSTHKVAAAAVGVAMVFSFAFVTPAQAQTVEELTAQINSLLSTIAGLQSQLSNLQGGGSTSASYNFTLNHELGDQGGEVMEIQKFLNAQGFTVATSGAGSPGNETSYFGSRTRAAVIAFQNANAAQILAPVGLSQGTGYWGPSTRAYANTLGGGAGTGTGTGTGTTPTGTGVTVSAAAQPGNALAPAGAARVPFTKFTLTNNSGSVQTINSVTVERTGLAQDNAFDGIVLLNQNGLQLGNARVLGSNHRATIGEAVTLQPGETHTFTVAANMESTLTNYAGEVASFSVVGINTSASVAGSLPISGASHTINATLSIGSVTAARGVEDPNAAQTKEIGTNDYTFTAIKLTAGSEEDVRLHSVRFEQSGSASASDLADVKVIVDGTTYTPTVSGDYYTVNFGSGLVIEEGRSKELVVKGDIISGTSRTVAFDVYRFTDIYATGETYGYGLTPTAGTGFTSSTPVYDASVVTISAGSFSSVSKSNAAPAANIAKQKSDELLGAFNVDIKGEGVTVQTLNFDVTVDAGVTTRSLTNVTLVDQNGAVLAGPVDSSSSLGSSTTTTDALTFSNVSFPTGVTTVYVRGQLDSDWAANDTLALSTNPNSDWSDATGDSTGDTVTLPGSTATANTMTVKTATFTATTLTTPAARSIVAGQNDFVFATASLNAANSGEDVRVTALVIEDTLGDAGDDAGTIDNVEIWANLSGGSSNDSVRGDKFETRVADAEQLTDGGNPDKTLSITLDTHITIAKNSAVEIAIVADLASGATTGDTHTISLDQAVNAVTAVGLTSGSTITGVTPSGAGQTMTVSSGGTLTVTVDNSSPKASLVLDNASSEQTLGVFRLAANNVESLDVDSIKITDDGTTTNGTEPVSKYVLYNGSTKLGEAFPTSGTAEVFLTDGSLTVPANGNVKVTVKGVMNDVVTNGVQNGDTVKVTIAAAGDVETTGNGSGSAVDSTDTSVDAATHTIYEAIPSFAFNNSGVSTVLGPSSNYLAAKIVITNSGDEDITFNATSSLQVNFEIAGTLTSATNAVKAIETSTGLTLDTVDMGSTTGSTSADIVFADNELTIPAGSSKEIQIRVNTAGLATDGNTLQAWLSDDAAGNLKYQIEGDSSYYSEGDDVFKGDIFGPTHVNPS